jgi:hypothetical protein
MLTERERRMIDDMNRRTPIFIALFLGAAACGSSSGQPAGGSPGDDATAGSGDGAGPGDGGNPDAAMGSGDGSMQGVDGGAGAPDAPTGAADASGGRGDAGDGGIVTYSGRTFPDTTASIALLVDQLPSMNMAQMQFAASHYVGTEKQVLSVTQALRALNPAFLVLHYHLAMWQSAPATQFIVNGTTWSNDYPTVTANETWFWHNAQNQRVTSSSDQKLLMNVSVQGFQQYWAQSLAQQVADGQYDGIMFDSASPALLQGECGGSGAGQDARLAATAARSTTFTELGGATWIAAWQTWISALSATLSAKGIPLIPNTSAFTTSWDNTDYTLSPGAFVEGFAGTGFAVSDWQASTNELLKLASLDRILILQNYLSATTDIATRMYYLGNYLLVKGHHTYLDYFDNGGPLEWYPEWGIDLGAPTTAATTNVAALASGGVYRRDFQRGSVFVNPTSSPVTVQLGATRQQVVPSGGGPVGTSGSAPGSVTMQAVTSVTVGATTAVVVL